MNETLSYAVIYDNYNYTLKDLHNCNIDIEWKAVNDFLKDFCNKGIKFNEKQEKYYCELSNLLNKPLVK